MNKIILALMLIVFLVACNKEEVTPNKNITYQKSEKTLKLIAQLTDVKNRIESRDNNNSRTDDDLTIEEGVSGVEAILNIYFASSSEEIKETNVSTIEFTIPVSDGDVTNANLTLLYNNAWQDLVNHNENLSWQNNEKHIVSINIKIESVDNDLAIIKSTSTIGKKNSVNDSGNPSCTDVLGGFELGDDWLCGGDENDGWEPVLNGDCNGDNLESGAINELEFELNTYYPIGHPFTSTYDVAPFHVGFYEIAINELNDGEPYKAPDFPDNSVNAPHIHRMYSGVFGSECIDYNDMNYYYCNMWHIIEDLTPSEKDFIYVEPYFDLFLGTNSSGILHGMDITFGTSIWVSDGAWTPSDGPVIDVPVEDIIHDTP